MPDASPGNDQIQADSVLLEITDSRTGEVFRRTLPLSYRETDNGIILTGENLSGKSSEIVFLSDGAFSKMRDITGSGSNKPRCGGES
jgi:hypothetical protein